MGRSAGASEAMAPFCRGYGSVMARVDYTGSARTYRAARALPPGILATWSAAVARPGLPRPALVLDLGAGPGGFVAPLADWFAAPGVARAPSTAIRSRARHPWR